MAEIKIIVSASTGAMNSVLGKLATLLGEEFAKFKNLRKEVEFISRELSSMKVTLETIAKVDQPDEQTRRWRDMLREMSYDIEDIVDDFMSKIGDRNKNNGGIVRRLRTLRARYRIAGQIEKIKALVLDTDARRQRYKLINIPPSSNVVEVDQRVVKIYENAANLVGVEGPTNELVNWLKYEENQLKVVSIVGFGGLGKTTLANEVHGRLKDEFDCCAFVTVSQKPEILKLLRSLVSELKISEPFLHDCEFNGLLKRLREHLENKRYLIIVDDIWDVNNWEAMKCAFPANDLGSRIIATTRIENVAKACCSRPRDYILKMKPLGNEDARSLFFGRIFGLEEACPSHLRDVSVEILKKCGGVPLAIITISSLLASKDSIQKKSWEDVRDSLCSGTDLTLEVMRKILNLSYKDLPCHLKTCLLYLGMYPEDYTIERLDLERQWMAEGFVSKTNEQDVEQVARNYFNELVNRSLIQPVHFDGEGSVTACKVHDMMLDLVLFISAEENFLTVVDNPQAIPVLKNKIRRLSLRLDGASNSTILPGNISVSQVRSLMIFGSSHYYTPPLSEFKFLRVFCVGSGRDKFDLTGLCKLYQLRYLRCNFWDSKLPIQINRLQHLETLDAWGQNVPSDIFDLPCLSFLGLPTSEGKMPDGIGKMKSLLHLDGFDLEANSLHNIEGLGGLTKLRYLSVRCGGDSCPDRKRRMDGLCSSLGKACTSLEVLRFSFCDCIDGLVLSPPPRRLEILSVGTLTYFSRVPNWIGELHNLRMLELEVHVLPKDGVGILAELPSLTHLDLVILKPAEMIVIYGRAFPVLKSFELTTWYRSPYLTFQAGAMPKLQRLRLFFNAYRWDQGAGPAGIEHLSALKEVFVRISGSDASETQKTSAESALRSAINMHPSHLRVEIICEPNTKLGFSEDEDEWESGSSLSSLLE